MVERSFYNECMDEQEVPEMQRSSLSHLVLKAKRLNLYPPKKLLSLAMDHPGLDRLLSLNRVYSSVPTVLIDLCPTRPVRRGVSKGVEYGCRPLSL
jgi:hypothetical protein